MTVKFTTTEIDAGKEGKIELLFEFLDHELGEGFDIDYMFQLGKSKYVGSLQSSQIQGAYLQPLVLRGTFYGTTIMKDGTKLTAKKRSDQLGQLAMRPVKFFFDNFKQIVIIEEFKRKIRNLERVEFELTMQPHDIQNPISPSETKKFLDTNSSVIKSEIPSTPKVDKKVFDDAQGAINRLKVSTQQLDTNGLIKKANDQKKNIIGAESANQISIIDNKYQDTVKGGLVTDFMQGVGKKVYSYTKPINDKMKAILLNDKSKEGSIQSSDQAKFDDFTQKQQAGGKSITDKTFKEFREKSLNN